MGGAVLMTTALDILPSGHLTRNEGLPTHTVRTDCGPSAQPRVRAMAGDIVLCSLARFPRCLSPPEVYKWVPANLLLGNIPAMD